MTLSDRCMHVEMNMDMFLSNLYVIFLIVPQKICLYSDSEYKVIFNNESTYLLSLKKQLKNVFCKKKCTFLLKMINN